MNHSLKVCLIVGSMLIVQSLRAQEHKLHRHQLPTAVLATIDRETHGATIKGFATEQEHGRKVYEAETILDGHTRDLQVAEDGTLNEIEEEVQLTSLPAAVQQSFAARAGGGKIVKVESLTKQGKLVAYEAVVLKSGKKSEVQVGPDGGKLAKEE
jgi:hypothetical protein